MDRYAPDSSQIVVAGRFLTGQEEERWQRALRDPVSGLLRLVLVILLAFFSIQAMGAAAASDWRLPSLVVPLIAGCLWFLSAWTLRARRHRRQVFENAWLDRWQDEKMVRAGCMIALYRDHAAYSTMRGSSLLPYSEVTLCCETADGILFGNDRFRICFRSADLTLEELVTIRRFLQERMKPSVYRLKAAAIPALAEPLPHVRFANFDTVITRAAVVPTDDKREFGELLGFVLPQTIIYSLAPALMTALTPWPLVNCLVFGTVFVLAGVLLTRLIMRLRKTSGRTPLRLAFTKEGIARQQDGIVSFTVRSRCHLYAGRAGVTVLYTSGERLDIPWSAIEDPDTLKNELA